MICPIHPGFLSLRVAGGGVNRLFDLQGELTSYGELSGANPCVIVSERVTPSSKLNSPNSPCNLSIQTDLHKRRVS